MLLGAGWPHPCAKARPPLPELVLFRGRGLPRTNVATAWVTSSARPGAPQPKNRS
jgi:hypothetical protein